MKFSLTDETLCWCIDLRTVAYVTNGQDVRLCEARFIAANSQLAMRTRVAQQLDFQERYDSICVLIVRRILDELENKVGRLRVQVPGQP